MKKAVSGLVVVVLLVAFAVAIGAMIIGWMQTYVTKTKDSVNDIAYSEIFCGSDIDFGIWTRDNYPMVCFNDSAKIIKIYLENRGRPIDRLLIRFTSINGSYSYYVNKAFNKGDVSLLLLNYSQVPNFVSFVIFPIFIDEKRASRMCKNKYIEVSRSKLSDCQYVAPFYY